MCSSLLLLCILRQGLMNLPRLDLNLQSSYLSFTSKWDYRPALKGSATEIISSTFFVISIFKIRCMCLCLYVGMCTLIQVPLEDREVMYFWSYSSRKLQVAWCGYWEMNFLWKRNMWLTHPSQVTFVYWVHNTNEAYLETLCRIVVREKRRRGKGQKIMKEGRNRKVKRRENKIINFEIPN